MRPPIIGITTGFQTGDIPQQTLNHNYVLAIERAGGCPVILPMAERSETLKPLYAQLNGLILTGGPGITDGLIGDLPDDLPPVASIRHQNDLYAFNTAEEKQIPILGICYGMQFINARFGGTLYADVQRQCNTAPHSPKRTGQKPIRHPITVESGTHLAHILNLTKCDTNSFHLQAIETPGQTLHINARSADGVIEGIETEDGRILGMQFHPEKMADTHFARIFDHFVQTCREHLCPTK